MFISNDDDLTSINTTIVMKVFPDGCLGFDLGSKLHNDILSKRLDYGIFAPFCKASMSRVAKAYLESIYDVEPDTSNEDYLAAIEPFLAEIRANKKRDDAIIKSLKQSLYIKTKTTEDEDAD